MAEQGIPGEFGDIPDQRIDIRPFARGGFFRWKFGQFRQQPGNPVDLVIDDSLRNGGDTKDILNLVNSLKADNIALVGHQPDFSYHVSNLISNGTAEIDFKKGAIAKIVFEGKAKLSRGFLEFLIPTGTFK